MVPYELPPRRLFHRYGKTRNQLCDFPEISTVAKFDQGGELLNAFVITQHSRLMVFQLLFDVRSCSLPRHCPNPPDDSRGQQ